MSSCFVRARAPGTAEGVAELRAPETLRLFVFSHDGIVGITSQRPETQRTGCKVVSEMAAPGRLDNQRAFRYLRPQNRGEPRVLQGDMRREFAVAASSPRQF